jgi:hypothetical protein
VRAFTVGEVIRSSVFQNSILDKNQKLADIFSRAPPPWSWVEMTLPLN